MNHRVGGGGQEACDQFGGCKQTKREFAWLLLGRIPLKDPKLREFLLNSA